MIKYVLFDLDGTLVDTSEGIIHSIHLTLRELNIRGITAEEMRRFIGPPLKTAFVEFCKMSPSMADEATKVFRKYYNSDGKRMCCLYPQVPQMLDRLKKAGFILIVATSKPTVFATEILNFLNIGQLFHEIVGSNMDNTRSYKQEIIQYILDKYHITNLNQAIMVGDKAQDLIGADSCGINGIGVTYGFGSCEELESVNHTAIVSSPQGVWEYIAVHCKEE